MKNKIKESWTYVCRYCGRGKDACVKCVCEGSKKDWVWDKYSRCLIKNSKKK